jgi:hypothetical protein
VPVSGAKTAAREAAAAAARSPFGRDLALPVARLAVAEAGLGREADALWHWQVARNLDPRPLSAEELRAFGPPGELLERRSYATDGTGGANAIWIMNGTVFSQTIVDLPGLQGSSWDMNGPR